MLSGLRRLAVRPAVAFGVSQESVIAVRLVTPEKIRALQKTLYLRAKESPTLRFYSLYDKVYRKDVLHHAYALCRANQKQEVGTLLSFSVSASRIRSRTNRPKLRN